ncbi:MAG: YbaY family lipoprotein [Acidobacteria bacterium]|nr:YbaY family lipoprotein [Acidobacteriota bacterium]
MEQEKLWNLALACTVVSAVIAVVDVSCAQGAGTDGSWLGKSPTSWNKLGDSIPQGRKTDGDPAALARCQEQTRQPESAADRALVGAGWKLYGPVQSYSGTSVITALSGVDGMCRPMNFQAFVFVNDTFAGTLSPTPMNSRSDGALTNIRLIGPTKISAEFVRYTASDPLCCPSKTMSVNYSLSRGGKAGVVNPEKIIPGEDSIGKRQGQERTVTGAVTYRPRIALPPQAVLRVELLDVSRADAPATVITQQTIETKGKQVPIPFSLSFDPGQIKEGNRYQVQAKIVVGEGVRFINKQAYPVITQGHPTKVTILLQSLPPSTSQLQNTYWKLVELNALPVTGEAHIQLNARNKKVQGNGGCNTIAGGYELTGNRIKFTKMISTKMACLGGMGVEQDFLKALEDSNNFKISGEKLELYSDDKLLARFEVGKPK